MSTTYYFVDSFTGKTLAMDKWSKGFPNDPSGGYSFGSSDQWIDKNVTVSDRLILSLTTKGTTDGSKYGASMITSYNKFHAMGGWIQAQLSLPKGNGLWPAFWLLPASYVGSGKVQNWEVDLEYLGNGNTVYFTIHRYGQQLAQWAVHNPELEKPHNYTFNWAPGKFLEFYFDGHLVGRTTAFVPNEPMFMLLNINSGGWNGNIIDNSTKLPASMIVNYVVVAGN